MERPLPQSSARTTPVGAARTRRTNRWSLVALAGALSLLSACKHEPPLPAPDPDGKDLVVGSIVAAFEASGGVRVYKVTQVDSIPAPAGDELHMVAYDPKAQTFEEGARLYRDHKLKIALPHILVRRILFVPRDHRIIGAEPVTPEEKLTIVRAQR